MEQPCHKCGQIVEEGRVFCPHCGAPQIRVLLAQPAGAIGDSEAASQSRLSGAETVPIIAVSSKWSRTAGPCATAALIASAAIVVQLIVPLIAGIGAGFLAVLLYRNRNPEIAVHARMGARIGAICALFTSGITAILGALRVAALHEGGKIRQVLLDAIQSQASRYPDPQRQATLDFVRSPSGLVLMLIALLVFGMILLIFLGIIGGALAGVGLGRRDR